MKNEMDVLGLDPQQRLAWLRANRATLMLVGLTWLGLIARELLQTRTPWFLIAMVPVFALVRFGLYRIYVRRA